VIKWYENPLSAYTTKFLLHSVTKWYKNTLQGDGMLATLDAFLRTPDGFKVAIIVLLSGIIACLIAMLRYEEPKE
jgi:hypothetical protein